MTSCKVIKTSLAACVLLAASSHASVLESMHQKTEIAEAVPYQLALGLDQSISALQGEFEQTIHHPNANFIKINFAKFSLPQGAYLQVSDLNEKELYRYDHNDSDVSSAMSISADAVKLKLVVTNPNAWLPHHGVEINNFFAGYPESEMAAKAQSLAADLIEPKSTCGINERRDVACWESTHPIEFERSRPVARLLIGGRSLCTAWRVGASNHMFTNNHCFDSAAEAKNVEVWFNYQRSACGVGEPNSTVKVMGDQLLATDYSLDYTLFTVKEFEKIKQFGHFGLDVTSQTQGQRIFIPQHGSGNPKELAIESDQNTTGYCQIDQTVTAGRGSTTDMGYKCDTIGGSSGSPVVSAEHNNVIALHHYGNSTQCTTKLNRGTRIELIWPKVSSHFGGVVPVGDNGNGGNTPPTANIQVNCNLLSCTFDASGSVDTDGTITGAAWQFGDGGTSSQMRIEHTYAQPGTYEVSLVVTDNEGAIGSVTKSVSVTDGIDRAPVALFTHTTNNLMVTFTDTSIDDNGVVGYDWQFGDGVTSQSKNPVHTYAVAGSYNVSLTVTDTAGQQDTVTHSVVVAADSGCSVGSWETNKVYLKGDQASQNGSIYEAKWWTRGDSPADNSTQWAVWKWVKACN
ncbi:PKD domain-containing protein [Pseudoalteromonas luteoviolacea]|uniref:PKD domain-containing protein n=1 Tax=Pseudoalteromonas luteoviolacea TaxID=43657 RepID=UPI001151A58C|nr:PKD domain-containing protein [Pseudoalteromonas luteoviolacea]TQF70092.1 PKD domain-containing protein [Pseudoalteromonas luteoviolacea]